MNIFEKKKKDSLEFVVTNNDWKIGEIIKGVV